MHDLNQVVEHTHDIKKIMERGKHLYPALEGHKNK